MYETLKMLEKIVTPEAASMTLEQLSGEYQKQQRPDLLAAAFKKVFPWIVKQKQKFIAFSEQEIGSIALERLDKSLIGYRGGAKFITYYSHMLHNELRTELESLLTQKRKANMFPTSFEGLVAEGFDLADSRMEYVNMELLLKCLKLQDDELLFCEATLQSAKVSNLATRDYLGWSDSKMRAVRKTLQTKLAFLINF